MRVGKLLVKKSIFSTDKGIRKQTRGFANEQFAFAKLIDNKKSALKLSGHAKDRMRVRGITLTDKELIKLNELVEKAESKGAKDSVVVMQDKALLVNVKNKVVVTVMDKTLMKEGIVTKIDSVIFG